ncbi:MAG: M28 family peptidase [Candidatus Krumholzibacteriota bacterium]|nr:M28 family peptidase [Candidatus Krumholzibacteriota bacterium]
MKKCVFFGGWIVALLSTPVLAGSVPIHHRLEVSIDPAEHYIQGRDTLVLSAAAGKEAIFFLMDSGLRVVSGTPGVTVELDKSGIKAEDFGIDAEDYSSFTSQRQNKYVLRPRPDSPGDQEVILEFEGKVHYPLEQVGEEYARGFSQSPGIIEERGVYLAGSTYWVPWFDKELITFALKVILPEGWEAVSQGRRTGHRRGGGKTVTRWECPYPMEEIYLVAAPFHEYRQAAGSVEVMAFLRSPDENLAHKYLETTAQYLEMYRALVGPYPYSKFALVENFWETGYGMPSFTLLGEQVIRFPFILHSSYPHELLHNWWGNSVYVDFDSGNWCEGITVYLADHLIKEQRGQGAEYRRTALQKFTDYVTGENDFPLTRFISRRDAPSEAIGYGKGMMVWNMLREKVGDEMFIRSFQRFYRDNRFRVAGYDDIRASFEAVTGADLKPFFEQWIGRTGAPRLRLAEAGADRAPSGYDLRFTLEQSQPEGFFELDVPVAVSFSDGIEIKKVAMTAPRQEFKLNFSRRPRRIRIDPQFNLMRELHHREVPPSLSKIFGAEKILILLPSRVEAGAGEAYRRLARIWQGDAGKEIEVRTDGEIDTLPAGWAVWIFGEENIHKKSIVEGLAGYDAELDEGSIRFRNTVLDRTDNSLVVAVRHPGDPRSVAVWLTVSDGEAVPGLSRKLPHYGKYSYLAFTGTAPDNIYKGQWEAVSSPLSAEIPEPGEDSPPIDDALPPRRALANLAPVFSEKRMMADVEYLSSEELEGRGVGTEGIERAAEFIARSFREAGLLPGADDGTYFQAWEDVIDGEGRRGEVRNVLGIIPGTDAGREGQSVVLCAHYDHLGRGWPDVRRGNQGKIHPGADDNASGVSVMIELARLLGKTLKPSRTLIFAAFTQEENGLRGSRHFVVHNRRFPSTQVMGAVNLDTVGRLRGGRLMVLGGASAREWKHIFMGASYVTGIETEMVTADLDASDQVAFIEAGVPAVQLFAGPHEDYHRPTDTADKIDAAGLVKVAAIAREAVLYLTEREEALSFSGAEKGEGKDGEPSAQRKVGTGSMPDFSYTGKGVRIGAVTGGSPAEKAGLRKGDVIIRLGTFPVGDLRDYSQALKQFRPGDRVEVVYLRGGSEKKTMVTLAER